YDIYHRQPIGVGFRYPESNGISGLFHGSLMIGIAPGKVSDNAYGNDNKSAYDFSAEQVEWALEKRLDGSWGFLSIFTDRESTNPVGVKVTEKISSYANNDLGMIIIAEWGICNDRIQTIDSLYAGLFLDWDVVTAQYNLAFWDEQERVAYTFHPERSYPYFGFALLTEEPTFVRAIAADQIWRSGKDEDKWRWMVEGFLQPQGEIPNDWAQLIGIGPYNLFSRDTLWLRVALGAGNNSEELFTHIQIARSIFNSQGFNSQRGNITINLFPQPANGSVQIELLDPRLWDLQWTICDITGRKIEPLNFLNPFFSPRTSLNISSYPAGIYILKGERLGSELITHPLLIIK
ncbi:MAG: T9SS type A sorting domain-containing protein, partial [bacterium]